MGKRRRRVFRHTSNRAGQLAIDKAVSHGASDIGLTPRDLRKMSRETRINLLTHGQTLIRREDAERRINDADAVPRASSNSGVPKTFHAGTSDNWRMEFVRRHLIPARAHDAELADYIIRRVIRLHGHGLTENVKMLIRVLNSHGANVPLDAD